MAITFPLSLPTATGIKTLTVTPESFVGVTESPFTGYQQVQRNQGQRWIFDVTLPMMVRADAAKWEAFFLSLNGREGTFTMGDPRGASPLGIATGSPQVKGAAQTGQSLDVDGFTPGVTGILKANDYVQLGTGLTARLYRQLVDVNSDGSGNATLTLWPRITASNTPADNAPLTLSNTIGLFRIADDGVPFAVSTALQSDYKFKAMSVV
jgi:hypothetical protein